MLKIIALFLPFFGMGQNLFLYSYKFFPNNQQKSANEMTMALKLDTKKSLFCPLEYLTSDEEDFIKKYFTNIEIVKNQNDSQATAFIPLESEMYEVALPNNLIVWKIHSERKNILGHEVNKSHHAIWRYTMDSVVLQRPFRERWTLHFQGVARHRFGSL